VIVSCNGDLRGVVEDLLGLHRRVRISVATFQQMGAARSTEPVWRSAAHNDGALTFIRRHITRITSQLAQPTRKRSSA
jgi:hypothetical protein